MQINREEETALSYKIIPVNKYRRNEGATKSPWDKHHSKNCGRQDSLKDGMVCEWKFEEELDVRIVSCISLKIFNNYEKKKKSWLYSKKKKKLVDSTWRSDWGEHCQW